MKKFTGQFIIALIAVFNLNLSHAYDVLYQRKNNLFVEATPSRIISLMPSITEAICSLGRCDKIIGVDNYSNYPDQIKSVKHIGSAMAPNLELILSLKPDLVVMSNNPRVSRRLEQLGVKVFVIDTVTQGDVHRLFEKLDEIFKTNEGQRVWQSMNVTIDEAADSLPKSVHQLRVYFEVSTGPYAAGESSFIGKTLTRLGVKNIVPKSLGDFPKLNPEFVVKQNPDLIIVSDNRISDLTQRPGWNQMSAIRNQNICTLTPEQSDIVVRPGPRMGEGAQIIAQCILNKGHNP